MDNEKLIKLVNNLPEIYQSIYIGDKLIYEGVRKNDQERFNVIKNYIKQNQTIFDVGSNTGYFTIKLAEMFPNCVIISLEKDIRYALVQQELLRLSGVTNVILVNGELKSEWLNAACQSCVYFDTTLFLSVLHHMANALDIQKNISFMSKQIIIEMPDAAEELVCGKEVLKEQLTIEKINGFKHKFEKLDYESSSHCDINVKRKFYRAYDEDYVSYRGKPYMDYSNDIKQYKIICDDNKKILVAKFNKKIIDMYAGICMSDVIKLGSILYPFKSTMLDQIEHEFWYLNRVFTETNEIISDIRPWNIIFSSEGLRFIDYIYHKKDCSDTLYNKSKDYDLIVRYIDSIHCVE